jgi:hypothetical protein
MADFSKFSRAIQEAIALAYQDLADQGLPVVVPAGLPVPKPVGNVYALSATRDYPAASSYTYETAVTSGSTYGAVCVIRAETGYASDGAPIVISGRNFRNDGAGNCAHVYMPSGRQVIFDDCTFASKSQNDFINVTDNSNVRVQNCRFYADGTQAIGITRGRAFYAFRPRNVEFENNYLLNTAGGKVEYWSANATASDKLLWRFNRIDNICGGIDANYRQAIQVQHVIRPNIPIAWNQIINKPGLSRVEDSINIGESGGTAASPFLVQDNLIWGGYQANPTSGGYTGAGITTDAGGQGVPASQQPQYIIAERNLIAGYQNACLNIAAGHHNRYSNNELVVSGFMPDGKTKLDGIYNAAAIFRGQNYSSEQFDFNEISNNLIFTNSANGKGPFSPNSTDPNVSDFRKYVGPNSKALLAGNTLNTYRDGAKYSDEQALFAKWQAKLTANKIQVGIPSKA